MPNPGLEEKQQIPDVDASLTGDLTDVAIVGDQSSVARFGNRKTHRINERQRLVPNVFRGSSLVVRRLRTYSGPIRLSVPVSTYREDVLLGNVLIL